MSDPVTAPAAGSVTGTAMHGTGETAAPGQTGPRDRLIGGRLTKRLMERWPTVRRQLPRDLAIVLVVAGLARFLGLAWVMTDSVHTSLVLVVKGAYPRPGELAVFAYAGEAIPGYYLHNAWTRAQLALGLPTPTAGPRKGDGFIKYLLGVPGDRVEVVDSHVWIVRPTGERLDAGACKPLSKAGVPLTPIASQVIPQGYTYMWAPHVDALDSRYAVMGLVPAAAIAGKGVALW